MVDNIIYSGDITVHPIKTEDNAKKRPPSMAKNAFKNQDDFACFCSTSPAELNLRLTNYIIPPLTLYSIENHKLECQIISIGNDINDRTKTTTSQEYDR